MSAVTGQPQRWARDFALIGATTSAVAPTMAAAFGVSWLYALAAAIAGAGTGALLGAMMPALLDRVRGRVPLPLLAAVGPLLGALWGASVGVLASVVHPDMLAFSVLAASVGGAVQFGLFWFPYTFQTVRGARVWPVVLAACLCAPLAGVISIVSTISIAFSGMPSLW